jgi:hypothetical protein
MRSFSTPAITFTVSQIDEEKGILHKVIVASAGKVKSYFEQIDSITLDQIASLGNSKENGIKARFGHPNMCSSAFGTYIGRFKNFQVENLSVFADLHLDPVCKESPSGNLYDYIMRMARNNPDMFGASIAFVPAEPEVTDEEFPSTRIEDLLATDLVDDPAATNSLFSVDSFAYQATTFLDNNPSIALLIAQKPDIILEFMFKYYSKYDLMKTEMFQKLRNLFKGSDNPANETATQEVSRIEKYFEDMSVKIGEAYAEILEKVRKSPIQFKQLENVGPLPASTDSILEQIVIRDNLTLENMFDDARIIVLSQLAQANELITYYNAAVEKLQQDHQAAVSTLQQNHEAAISILQQEHQTSLSTIQDHASNLEFQITTLQDQLKAKPTMVDGIDPQLKINNTEESFGKRLLSQMPKELKEKIKKVKS